MVICLAKTLPAAPAILNRSSEMAAFCFIYKAFGWSVWFASKNNLPDNLHGLLIMTIIIFQAFMKFQLPNDTNRDFWEEDGLYFLDEKKFIERFKNTEKSPFLFK